MTALRAKTGELERRIDRLERRAFHEDAARADAARILDGENA
jgi:hypothetical protein